MRVFVTGGTGFVGRHVVRTFLEAGHSVALGVRSPEKAHRVFGSEVEVYEVNFFDQNSIRKALVDSKAETIVHLIGILLENRRRGETFENVHYLFSTNLYNSVREVGIRKVAHMSALGTHKDAPSRYHRTKLLAEKVLIDSGIEHVILRPSLILGPEQRLFFDMDRITKLLPVVALPGGGSYRFQPVDVRDVAESFLKALEGSHSGVYELCGSRAVSFRELLEDIFSFWKRKVLMVPLPTKLMYYMGKVAETFLQPPPFSSDQMLMMWKDNVCGVLGGAKPNGVEELTDSAPIPYEESLRWSLEGYSSLTS